VGGGALDGGDNVGVDFRRFARHPERAVLLEPSRAAGDLADLLRLQPAQAAAVEFAQAGEGDMVDVHVEAHADGVGGDEKIDLAGLEQLHLRVAGARAERAHHHRRAAALAADQFGDGVDLIGGEGDDGRALRQPGQFLRSGVDELRKALARLDLDPGDEAADERRRRRGPHEHRLRMAPRVQQTMGEDMAALGVGDELDLVDGEEFDAPFQRHSLDRADPIGGLGGDDLLLAGDERDMPLATRLHHPVVDFARQQPKRQPDHARSETQHPLDRQMRLAGVGRAEHGDEAGGRAGEGEIVHLVAHPCLGKPLLRLRGSRMNASRAISLESNGHRRPKSKPHT